MNHNIKHIKTGFKTPDNYFKNFEEDLFEQLDLNSKTGFKVPNNYFENVSKEIIKTNVRTTKVVSLFTRKNLTYITSIAAVLMLSILIYPKEKDTLTFEDIEYSNFEEYVNEEVSNTYELADLYSIENDELDQLTEITFDNDIILDYLSEEEISENLLNNF